MVKPVADVQPCLLLLYPSHAGHLNYNFFFLEGIMKHLREFLMKERRNQTGTMRWCIENRITTNVRFVVFL